MFKRLTEGKLVSEGSLDMDTFRYLIESMEDAEVHGYKGVDHSDAYDKFEIIEKKAGLDGKGAWDRSYKIFKRWFKNFEPTTNVYVYHRNRRGVSSLTLSMSDVQGYGPIYRRDWVVKVRGKVDPRLVDEYAKLRE